MTDDQSPSPATNVTPATPAVNPAATPPAETVLQKPVAPPNVEFRTAVKLPETKREK